MNHTRTLFATLTLLLLALAACQDGNDFGEGYTPSLEKDPTPDPDKLTINPTSLNVFDAKGGTQPVTVTANTTWSMSIEHNSSSTGWLTLSPSSGNFPAGTKSISITASENTSTDSRSATITFTCGTATPVTLTVTQQGVGKHTSASPEKFDIGYPNDTTCIITVTSNEAWGATMSDKGTSWGWTVKPSTTNGNGTVSINIPKNLAAEKREATVTVKGADSGDTTPIKISQPGIELRLGSLATFPATGGNQELNVTCNTNDWTASSSDESVCTVNKKDNETLVVTCSENTSTNQRSATVTVKAGNVTQPITVIQDPNVPSPYTKVTSPTDNKLSFGLASETKYIEVESNEDWEVSEENTSWLASVDTEKTENGGRVAVKSKANDTETAYTAKIIIKGKSSGNTASIDISQEGIIIKGVPESKEFGNGADKYTFSFECNTTWEASSNQTWCTVSPSGRQTGKSLTIYVTENTYTSQRPATVTIKVGNGNVERNISVTQQGTAPYIYIDGEKSITVESTGSEKTIKIATNDSPFTPGSDKEWCTVESVDQTNKTFKIKVKSNGTLSTRTATITVTSKSDKTDTMTVTQKAGNIGVEEYDENDNPIK